MNVTQELYRETLMKKVLLAISKIFPCALLRSDVHSKILLQEDNAKPSIGPYDSPFREHFESMKFGFDVELLQQPSNSPGFNVLYLGFFKSIDCTQDKLPKKSIAEKSLQRSLPSNTI